jgi:hypothetical protein
MYSGILISVVDRGIFVTDPDPRFRTTDFRISILLFSSVAGIGKIPLFFFQSFFCLLLIDGTFTSDFIDKKSKRSQ